MPPMNTGTNTRTNTRTRATLIGFSAVLMWALLAALTALAGPVPPFQLTAMTFLVGTLTGLGWFAARGTRPRISWNAPRALAFSAAGLFLYHAFYFTALQNAPAVEASLIAYLWPLLIVVGSALLPGERLRAHHVIGAVIGLGGAVLLVTKGEGFSFDPQYAFGYAMALVCALTWSTYSLGSRAFRAVTSDSVLVSCAVTTALALVFHLALEETVWPAGSTAWLAILGLGLLPVGAAFFTWDHGCKHGDIQVIGAASYLTPLLSTLVLLAIGNAEPTWTLGAATVLITLGALVAARNALSATSS